MSKTIQEKIKIMQAFADGQKIQFCIDILDKTNWEDVEDPCWNWEDVDYRIKPKSLPKVGDIVWITVDNFKYLNIVWKVDPIKNTFTTIKTLTHNGSPMKVNTYDHKFDFILIAHSGLVKED